VKEAAARLKKTLGPWTQHKHVFGCDCGIYQANHPMRGAWWYRPTAFDDREGIVAMTADGREVADKLAVEAGFLLVDQP
jgi:hypothetical protein